MVCMVVKILISKFSSLLSKINLLLFNFSKRLTTIWQDIMQTQIQHKIRLNSPFNVNVKELVARKNNIEAHCFVSNHTNIWSCLTYSSHLLYFIIEQYICTWLELKMDVNLPRGVGSLCPPIYLIFFSSLRVISFSFLFPFFFPIFSNIYFPSIGHLCFDILPIYLLSASFLILLVHVFVSLRMGINFSPNE